MTGSLNDKGASRRCSSCQWGPLSTRSIGIREKREVVFHKVASQWREHTGQQRGNSNSRCHTDAYSNEVEPFAPLRDPCPPPYEPSAHDCGNARGSPHPVGVRAQVVNQGPTTPLGAPCTPRLPACCQRDGGRTMHEVARGVRSAASGALCQWWRLRRRRSRRPPHSSHGWEGCSGCTRRCSGSRRAGSHPIGGVVTSPRQWRLPGAALIDSNDRCQGTCRQSRAACCQHPRINRV